MTLTDVLFRAAAHAADQVLVHVDGAGAERVTTYAGLYADALQVAGGLREAGLAAGDPLIVLAEDGADFLSLFWGAILAGVVPVPLPPEPGRLAAVWRHLGRPPLAGDTALDGARLLSLSMLRAATPLTAPVPTGPGDLAFLQFSSGSTGTPKGVELTHGNVTANLDQAARAGTATAADVVVTWMPYFHDMGLIGTHLVPLYVQCKQVRLSPLTFAKRPELWLRTAAKHRATVLSAANFALALTARRVSDPVLDELDLSSVRLVMVGAEPISPAVWRAFTGKLSRARLDPHALQPVYGLAEATVAVTFPPMGELARPLRLSRAALARGVAVDAKPAIDLRDTEGATPGLELIGTGAATPGLELVDAGAAAPVLEATNTGPATPAVELMDVGYPVPGCTIRVVDDADEAVEDGLVGHIQVRGPNVTRGYHRDPVATAAALVDGWLRTGDIGFVRAGRLCVTGRAKDVLLVHGRTFHAADLEEVAAATPGLGVGPVAVVGSTDPVTGRERVVVFLAAPAVRADAGVADRVRSRVAEALGYDEVRVRVVPTGAFARTTSGKLRRQVLRDRVEAETNQQPEPAPQPVTKPAPPPVTEPCLLPAAKLAPQPTTKPDPHSTTKPDRSPPREPGLHSPTKPDPQPTTEPGTHSATKPSLQRVTEPGLPPTTKPGPLPVTMSVAEPDFVGTGVPMAAHDSVPRTRAEVEQIVRAVWARVLRVPAERIGADDRFLAIGGSSLAAMEVLAALEDVFGRTLDPAALRDCVTVPALADRLLAATTARPAPTPAALPAAAAELAVIGMACRFPDADTPEQFWANLLAGRDSVTPVTRWPGGGHGAFLADPALFDAQFFGIDDAEARYLDPHARIFLELAHEALERAGYAGPRRHGRRVGVFAAVGESGYPELLGDEDRDTPYALTGALRNLTAARVAHLLDLHGPALAVDTACSSALVALHLARQSLAAGDCDLAVVGGVSLNLTATGHRLLAGAQALSPTGRCRAFAADADGFVPGEGGAALVLTRLADAGDDRVLAVVRGTAVNNDGRSLSLMAPNPLLQQEVIAQAYRDCGVDPAEVTYVEAHGTGTAVGDPIEARSLAYAFPPLPGGRPRLLGSVKTNIGHLLNVAGLPSLVKVILAVQHRELPPTLHHDRPSPRFDLAGSGFEVVTARRPWTGPPVAGINSFGFGGTNAHAILAAPPPALDRVAAARADGPHLLTLSAGTPVALRAAAGDLMEHLRARPELAEADVCATASTARDDGPYRIAVVSHGDLAEKLAAVVPGRQVGRQPRVAYLFGGPGIPSPGQGASLYATAPEFRAVLDEVSAEVGPIAGRSLVEWCTNPEVPAAELARIEVARPVAVAFGIAQAAQLGAFGLRPDAVTGHGIGELAAAVTAGMLTAVRAVRLAAGSPASLSPTPGPTQVPPLSTVTGEPAQVPPLSTITGEPAQGPPLTTVTEERPQTRPLTTDTAEPTQVPLLSTVTGEWGAAFDAAYLAAQAARPVRFEAAIDRLQAAGYDTFIAVGAAFVPVGTGTISEAEVRPAGDDAGELLTTVGEVWLRGAPLDRARLDAGARRVVLPTYPFQRRRHWVTDPPAPELSTPRWVDAPESAATPAGGPVTVLCAEPDTAAAAATMTAAPAVGHLLVITEDLYATGAGAEQPNPAHAVWTGLAMALADENAQLGVRVVDLCSGDPEAARRAAVDRESADPPAPGPAQIVAWRDGRRLVRTFAPAQAVEPMVPPPDGRYLIVGGAGAVGTAIARHLARRGRPYLLLAGRSAEPAALLDELRGLGATVAYRMADVAVAADVAALVAGDQFDVVVHAAGVVRPGSLRSKTPVEVADALAAKVRGTELLARALRHQEPLIVALSSISSVLPGLAGAVGDYVAGNAFLDAFAAAERAAGRRFVAVNLPALTGGGLAAAHTTATSGSLATPHTTPVGGRLATARDTPAGGSLAAAGSDALPVDRVPDVLWAAAALDAAQVLVRSPRSGVSPPVEQRRPASPEPTTIRAGNDELVALLGQLLAGALEREPDTIGPDEPFLALGLDSLTAIDLVKELETRLGRTLSTTLFFEHQTIGELARHLADAPNFPLSPVQRAFDTNARLYPTVPSYAYVRQTLTGPVDPERLGRAFAALERRHPMLRVRFGPNGQRIAAPSTGRPGWFTVTELAGPVATLDAELRNRPFDLTREPPVRAVLAVVRPDLAHLLLVVHHAAADGFSIAILGEELWALYCGNEPPAPPRATFADHEALRSDPTATDLAYWKNALARYPGLALPFDGDPGADPRPPFDVHQVAADPALAELLRERARTAGVSLFHLLLAGYVRCLSRWSGQRLVPVAVARAGRTARLSGVDRMVGPFADTLPVLVRVDADEPAGVLAGRLREAWLASERHGSVSTVDIARMLATNGAGPRTASPASFSFARFPGAGAAGEHVVATTAGTASAATRLGLVCIEAHGALHFSWNYPAALFHPATVRRFADEHLAEITALVEAQPQHRAAAPLPSPTTTEPPTTLPPSADADLLADLPTTLSPSAGTELLAPVVERIRAQCRRTPDGIAVLTDGVPLSYLDLDLASDRLAARLAATGARRIGLLTGPGAETVVGVLGILKAGAAWVPMDAAHPPARLAGQLTRAGADVVVCDATTRKAARALDGTAPDHRFTLIESSAAAHALPPPVTTRPDDPAYVIFTSGSGGRPKGVAVTHRAMANYLDWAVTTFGYRAGDRLAQTASICFDASVRQLLAPLLVGATVVAWDRDTVRDPGELLLRVERDQITVWSSVPTLWERLLGAAEKRPHPSDLSALRWVHVGGEELSPTHVRRWYDLFGPGQRITNLYGPTETTINATYHVISERPADDVTQLPIGRPVGGALVEVLGPDGRCCAPDEVGELYIGGVGVAGGYLDDPDLTAAAFVERDTRRWYRSGDRAVRDADGVLWFRGRVDDQVKLHGYRVEPGEVEAVLHRHPAVDRSAVRVEGDRLLAWVRPRGDAEPTGAELREYLAGLLPEYLLPARVEVVPELPLTATGKIDRAALSPAAPGSGPGDPPATATERLLAQVWSRQLGVARVERDDDFFALGGDSIGVLDLFATLEEHLPALPRPTVIYRHRTVASLAAEIDATQPTPPAQPDQPAQTDQPTRADQRTRADHPTQSSQPTRADQPTQTDQPTRADQPTQASQPTRADQPTQTSQPMRADQPDRAEFPLSLTQRGFLLADAVGTPSTWLAAPRIHGPLDRDRFQHAVDVLVARHPMLRTVFRGDARPPVQRELPTARLAVAYDADPGELADELAAERAQRLDPAHWPLVRMRLLRLGPEEHILLLHAHHLVGDGYSVALLARELLTVYDRGEIALPPLRSTFREYVALLDGLTPTPAPHDTGCLDRGAALATTGFTLDPASVAALRAMAAEAGATPFVPVLTAYHRGLVRLAARPDPVVGVAVTGRDHALPDLARIFGPCATAVAVRPGPTGGFADDLDRTAAAVTAARTRTFTAPQGWQFFFTYLDFDALGPLEGETLRLSWADTDAELTVPPGTDVLLAARPVDDGLRLTLRGRVSPQLLDRLAAEMHSDLTSATEHRLAPPPNNYLKATTKLPLAPPNTQLNATQPASTAPRMAPPPSNQLNATTTPHIAPPNSQLSATTPLPPIPPPSTHLSTTTSHIAPPPTDRLDAALVGYLPAPAQLAALAGKLPAHVRDALPTLDRETLRAALFPGRAPRLLETVLTPLGRSGFVCLPRFADELTHGDLAADSAAAVDLAATHGARTVSLAGMIPAHTGYGTAVTRHVRTAAQVTTGHAVTAAAVVRTAFAALAAYDRPLSGSVLAVVGVGSIGRSSLGLLLARAAQAPAGLLLCDLPAAASRLADLAAGLRAAGYPGPIDIVTAGPSAPEAVYRADIVIAATSGGPGTLDVDRLRPGTIVVDDSFPHCFDPARALARMRDRNDVLVVGGGLLDCGPAERTVTPGLPAAARFGLPGAVASCQLESLLHAATPGLPLISGPVDADQAAVYWDALNSAGVHAAPLHLLSEVVRTQHQQV